MHIITIPVLFVHLFIYVVRTKIKQLEIDNQLYKENRPTNLLYLQHSYSQNFVSMSGEFCVNIYIILNIFVTYS